MIMLIPVQSVPNQSLNVVIGSTLTTLNINTRNVLQGIAKDAQQITMMDIITNTNNAIINGVQVNELPVIPYQYLAQSAFAGNFIFVNIDGVDRSINYNNFGITQFLIFYNFSDFT